MRLLLTKSVGPDQIASDEQSDLDLHFLFRPFLVAN